MTPPLILGVALRLVSSAYHFATFPLKAPSLWVFWVDALSGRLEERLSRFQRSQRMSGLACLLLRLQDLWVDDSASDS